MESRLGVASLGFYAVIRAVIFACIALGIALIGLMFRASSNNTFFGEQYPWLFGVGIALTVGLLALIGYQIYSLWRKLKNRVFGAKLALRLMAVFALMAVIPGGLVYTISVQFLNRPSIRGSMCRSTKHSKGRSVWARSRSKVRSMNSPAKAAKRPFAFRNPPMMRRKC